MIEFDIPKDKSSIIKVFGVGGGGSNAVTHMYEQGIAGVNYVICNTDNQALELSSVPNKIQLGSSLREGLGAGNKPEIGREATEEAIDKLEEVLQANTKMIFITAGMGGGTGTGGAPVVARLAKDMGILTVGIVTTPFSFEGKKRLTQANAGIDELKEEVDALLVISNDKLREIHGNLKINEAFGKADDILTVAAKGIAEIITKTGYINVDFEDVNTVMRDSGVALMGIGLASGEQRAIHAVEEAMSSPLLNDNNITGARSVLLNISYGSEGLEMDEMADITDYITEAIQIESDNLIWGLSEDDDLTDEVRVTLIATGFESNAQRKKREQQSKRVIHTLNSEDEKMQSKEENRRADQSKPYLRSEQNDEVAEDRDNSTKQFTFEFEPISNDDQKEQEPDSELSFDEESAKEFYAAEEVDNEPVSNASPVSEPFRLPQTSDNKSEEHKQNTPQQQQTNKFAEREQVIQKELNSKLKRLQSFNVRPVQSKDEDYVPAYKRKNIEIDTTPRSGNENVSRYSLGESGEDGFQFGKNSYLHDNVD